MEEWYDIEKIILGMADMVYENRKLRREVKELREYKERNDKRLNEQVSNNFKTSAELINKLFSIDYGKEKEEFEEMKGGK